MTIRRFRAADAEGLAALMRGFADELKSADPWALGAADFAGVSVPEGALRIARERAVLVADVAGTLVGTVALAHSRVYALYVRATHRRLGIGTELLARLERLARRQCCEGLAAYVRPGAVAFYACCGFEHYREVDMDGVVFVEMVKPF